MLFAEKEGHHLVNCIPRMISPQRSLAGKAPQWKGSASGKVGVQRRPMVRA